MSPYGAWIHKLLAERTRDTVAHELKHFISRVLYETYWNFIYTDIGLNIAFTLLKLGTNLKIRAKITLEEHSRDIFIWIPLYDWTEKLISRWSIRHKIKRNFFHVRSSLPPLSCAELHARGCTLKARNKRDCTRPGAHCVARGDKFSITPRR